MTQERKKRTARNAQQQQHRMEKKKEQKDKPQTNERVGPVPADLPPALAPWFLERLGDPAFCPNLVAMPYLPPESLPRGEVDARLEERRGR